MKKIFNFNLCEKTIEKLDDLMFYFELQSLSKTIEKILNEFCNSLENQKNFFKWKKNFKLPEIHRLNRTYYLDTKLHDCLIEMKNQFKIRNKGEMLRFLIFFYHENNIVKNQLQEKDYGEIILEDSLKPDGYYVYLLKKKVLVLVVFGTRRKDVYIQSVKRKFEKDKGFLENCDIVFFRLTNSCKLDIFSVDNLIGFY